MANENLLYGSLVFSMALGGVIVVGGIFVQNGIGTIAALGSVFILLSVGGLAYLASVSETETESTVPDTRYEESESTPESKTG